MIVGHKCTCVFCDLWKKCCLCMQLSAGGGYYLTAWVVRSSYLCLKFIERQREFGSAFSGLWHRKHKFGPHCPKWFVLSTIILLVTCDALILPRALAGFPNSFPDRVEDAKENWHEHFPPTAFMSYLQPRNSLWTPYVKHTKLSILRLYTTCSSTYIQL